MKLSEFNKIKELLFNLEEYNKYLESLKRRGYRGITFKLYWKVNLDLEGISSEHIIPDIIMKEVISKLVFDTKKKLIELGVEV